MYDDDKQKALMTDLRPDTRRLMFLMKSGIDGLANVQKDRHEYAMEVAHRWGREEPNEMDELIGFREMIDDAMDTKCQKKFADIKYYYTRYTGANRVFSVRNSVYINCETLEEAINAAWSHLTTDDFWPLRITAGALLWESGPTASESLSNFAQQCGMQPLL